MLCKHRGHLKARTRLRQRRPWDAASLSSLTGGRFEEAVTQTILPPAGPRYLTRASHTNRIAKNRTISGNCDTAVIRRPTRRSGEAGIVFRNSSGARALNPGPHGPEPASCRVRPYPDGSSTVLPYSIAA